MTQAVIAYALTAAAAAWVVWSVLLPKSVKTAIRAKGKPAAARGCGPDCGCGD